MSRQPIVILADDRKRIQIRINGPDVEGKNTCRQISVLAVCVEQVEEFLNAALRLQTPDGGRQATKVKEGKQNG